MDDGWNTDLIKTNLTLSHKLPHTCRDGGYTGRHETRVCLIVALLGFISSKKS